MAGAAASRAASAAVASLIALLNRVAEGLAIGAAA
jgi:hypothetical protein